MRGGVGMAVGVAVEAGDAKARAAGAPIVRGIELLLRERREQEPQTLKLLGIEDAVEQLEIVVERMIEGAFRRRGPKGKLCRGLSSAENGFLQGLCEIAVKGRMRTWQ